MPAPNSGNTKNGLPVGEAIRVLTASRAVLGQPMPEELARGRSRAFSMLKRHFAIDHNGVIALGPLDSTPLISGKVVGDFAYPVGVDIELIQIIHNHVGGGPFA